MFNRILIANRGEIACRIIKSAKKMGISTVAVYSYADKNALHVKLADEAICIGPAPAQDSYLQIDKIITAAQQTNAEAIHPGYGFLAENESFAIACEKNNIVFIGPPIKAIQSMGLKATAKVLMDKAKVPLMPGYHGENQDPDFLHQEASRIGYPLLIKASAGGGGKGMSLVESSDQFLSSLASCQREALSSFNNADVLLEKYITQPRHIEIQVFGDNHGNYVHLFERDCSVQRRHQKVLEEAPAPNINEEHLHEMRQAAINAAKAVGYIGAGTVEFIVHQNGEFYFMEMNTRLQVEHPVTEMITGEDLVEWQLRVAYGEPLPKQQEELNTSGHALEARIYAEDPDNGFLPSTGEILYMHQPQVNHNIRIDSGIEVGDVISPHYDPMIAKLIVWGENREEALRKMHHALGDFNVLGVKNNTDFLRRIIKCDSFSKAQLETGLIEQEKNTLKQKTDKLPTSILIIATLGKILLKQQNKNQSVSIAQEPLTPWHNSDGWRLNSYASQQIDWRYIEDTYPVNITYNPHGKFTLLINGESFIASAEILNHGELIVEIENHKVKARVFPIDDNFSVFVNGETYTLDYINPYHAVSEDDNNDNHLVAPMPGKVIKVWVNNGNSVKKDEALIVLEAMKMEHTITAPSDGIIDQIHFHENDQVTSGDVLLSFLIKEKEDSHEAS